MILNAVQANNLSSSHSQWFFPAEATLSFTILLPVPSLLSPSLATFIAKEKHPIFLIIYSQITFWPNSMISFFPTAKFLRYLTQEPFFFLEISKSLLKLYCKCYLSGFSTTSLRNFFSLALQVNVKALEILGFSSGWTRATRLGDSHNLLDPHYQAQKNLIPKLSATARGVENETNVNGLIIGVNCANALLLQL